MKYLRWNPKVSFRLYSEKNKKFGWIGTKEGFIFIFIFIFSDSPNYDVNIAPRRNWKKCTGLYAPTAKPTVARPAVVRPPHAKRSGRCASLIINDIQSQNMIYHRYKLYHRNLWWSTVAVYARNRQHRYQF